jgi:flavin-binding protein dodecin
MILMKEVVGISNTGYSEAINSAVTKLMDVGHTVYWFEIMEQRGAVKGSDIEYQVKVKVAVESE